MPMSAPSSATGLQDVAATVRRSNLRTGVSLPAPIRVLKFVTLFGFGGTEKQVMELARRLDAKRFDLRFACLRRWGHFLDDIERQHNQAAEYPIRSFLSPGTTVQQYRYARNLRRQHVNIAHSYNFYANLFSVPAARLP